MNRMIPTYRAVLSLSALVLSLIIALFVPVVWPYIDYNSQIALALMGVALALKLLTGDFQGRSRSASGLAIGAALLTASALALVAPATLALSAGLVFQDWMREGFSFFASLGAAGRAFTGLSESQRLALMTSLAVGLPVPVIGLVIILEKVLPKPNNRVQKKGPWRAQWMSQQEINQLRHNETGLPLGLHKGAILRYRPNAKQGWRQGHHAAIAGTRAGKGVSVVIPAIIDHDGPVAVLDIKGENFAITRRYRQSLGRRVIVLNPFGVHEASTDCFNPLDYIRPDHLVRDIDVIAEGLVRPEHGNGSHFAEMAKSMIAGILEAIVENGEADERNLPYVIDMVFSADFEKSLSRWAEHPELVGKRPAAAAATFLAAGENERGAIRTTILRAFEWARSDEMRTFLSGSNCSLDDVFHGEADLFLVVPLDQIDAQAVFLRLMTNIILGTAVRLEGSDRPQKNVLLVLDEFVRLGRMEKLVNIANVAAGCGIEALFITQDKGQIESVYGRGDTASILGSCVTTRIFGLGRAEYETASWAANALGDQTVLTRSRQPAVKLGQNPRITTSESRQKLMTADQILELKAGKMLLLTGSKAPVVIDAVVSHASPIYQEKLGLNPMAS